MNKTAVITGGAQGLGLAMAKQLAKQNWHLMLLDIDGEKLKSAKSELEAIGQGRTETYDLDLTDDEDIQSFLSGLSLTQEPIHLLINNAGITHRSSANYTDQEVFDRVMALNWRAAVQLTRGLLPALQDGQGVVTVIGSMAGWLPLPGRAAYCASKAAVNQHFETWRPELKRKGIDVTLCFPSFLDTGIAKHALGTDGLHAQTQRSTVGSVGSADDMAKHIVVSSLKRKPRVWGHQFTARLGYYIWHLLPALYRRITWKKFNEDIIRGD
ncbi:MULTISPECIES: SDR family oxidoreductase [Gammaproteobacteria]|uniref:SDR family NAD(P)-dependent oxidoreductase n=1 Tax=Gammaproteobacteria TaxID=1236 RepID=UPI000DD041BA|nr:MULTISPECIES: SDR family NAD(P)-dependent oxidoreductase [Gammaproteobacteria]RTE85938.1 SDR family NAD(P)-dependent oxidoreductase [Aliidiomarina sp. B3213]TCZ90063.1 SDR family NAD(P)-dependent oxidoreductase [Lysobacter sp. N42]